MQILGLLGMYFDAVVVFVKNNSPLFRLVARERCLILTVPVESILYV